MKKLYLALIVAPFALLGCGGEGAESSTSSNNSSVEREPVIYSQDGIVRTFTGQKLSINLSERNVVSNGQELAIDDITSLSSNAQCDPISVSGMTFALGAFENPTMCQYKYSLRSVETGVEYVNPNMVTNVIVQEKPLVIQNSLSSLRSLPSTTLPPIQVSVSKPGSVVKVDLNSRLASLYPKDENGKNYVLSSMVLVLGSGSAKSTTNDLGKSIVEYTSDSYDRGGITRLIYSLSDDFTGTGEGDFKVGAIDISVSSSGSNSTPETKYFQWSNNGSDIKAGQKYTIDVASDISAECTYGREPQDTKGSCIYDADSDSLQIVGVYAYDATVAPTSLTQLDNTKFDVTFRRTGTHDISYQVSDHNGGFATGIVRVNVEENTPPVLYDNPKIVYISESSTFTSAPVNKGLATDLEGDDIWFKSITSPSSDKIIVSESKGTDGIGDEKIIIQTKPNSEGIYEFKTVVTDGVNDIAMNWIAVINSLNHLMLKDESSRTFSTDVNVPITIDISSIIENLLEGETVSVNQVIGSLYGTVEIDKQDSSKVIYTPDKNTVAKDDFVFKVITSKGAEISGNIIITVGDVPIGGQPALVISSVDASEGENNLITASVVCERCDVTKYEYSWIIADKVISNEKSFTITPEQRAYAVTLLVVGYDVFGQSDYKLTSLTFYPFELGTFDSPAESCDDIYRLYNSSYNIIADDGEYWLKSVDGSYKYKVQCDMVSQPESDLTGKAVGGYTLVWSYSEKTNLERFGGNTKVFSQNNKGLSFEESRNKFPDGIGLVKNSLGEVNYNNFRLPLLEYKTKFEYSYVRVLYTSDPSPATINHDPDGVSDKWYLNTTGLTAFFSGSPVFLGPNTEHSGAVGAINGIKFNGEYSAARVVELTAVETGKSMGSLTGFSGIAGYSFVSDNVFDGQYLYSVFGDWGKVQHQYDLFGMCTNPKMVSAGSKYTYALGCNGDVEGEKTYHVSINNGEGYVTQWWAGPTK